MTKIFKLFPGIIICLIIAVFAWLLGNQIPVVGGAVFGILIGMFVTLFKKEKGRAANGIKFTSKYILQAAVVFLGFGLNLNVIIQTGKTSLPIIVTTIAIALIVAYILYKFMKIPTNTATLVGIGSSICGGSAIAATAPVIGAKEEEIAQSISVVFFFNVLAALTFPALGSLIGFDTTSGYAFGVFSGTAVNDTSSVTATASTWDGLYSLGSDTLDTAVTVKLTRTLAIIPITLILAIYKIRKAQKTGGEKQKISLKKAFPIFILFFILASVVTTISVNLGVDAAVFSPMKTLSKFLIVMAMAAIGLNTDVVKLIKTGGKPLIIGACCWVSIIGVSLLMQRYLGIW